MGVHVFPYVIEYNQHRTRNNNNPQPERDIPVHTYILHHEGSAVPCICRQITLTRFLILPGRDGRQSSPLVHLSLIVKSHSCTLAHAAIWHGRLPWFDSSLMAHMKICSSQLPVFLARLSLLPSSFLHDAAQCGGRTISSSPSSCSSPDFDKVEFRNA